MDTVPLSDLQDRPQQEDIEEFIERIPDGEALTLKSAILETGITSRKRWEEVAGNRIIQRYYNNKPCNYLVNQKTADSLQDG